MDVFYSDPFTFPLPEGHRFPLAKYRLLRERVQQLPASSGAVLHLAPRATRDELLAVHTAAYLDAFAHNQLPALAMQRIGFPWSEELVERSLRSCGGTLAATRSAVRGGAAIYLAGGTHHARADRGAGYCVYNDCAAGARLAQRELGIAQVLVVDTDVHQGDGTAAIFRNDASVFTFSIHGAENFPGQKERSDLDLALPSGTGDDAYLQALARGLDESFARCTPQLVYHLAGADPFGGDRLGRLALTKQGLAQRDRMVLAACARRGLPVVTVMGGGYGRDITDTVDVYFATVTEALAYAPR